MPTHRATGPELAAVTKSSRLAEIPGSDSAIVIVGLDHGGLLIMTQFSHGVAYLTGPSQRS